MRPNPEDPVKTCANHPLIAHRNRAERNIRAEVQLRDAEALHVRIDADRFVRTTSRTHELCVRVDGQGLAPAAPSHAPRCGHGYAHGPGGGDVAAAQKSRLEEVARLAEVLTQLKGDYRIWRQENPAAAEPTDGCRSLGAILDDPTLSTGELCVHLVAVICHERPETAAEVRACLPHHEQQGQGEQAGPPANTEISRGIFSLFGMGANLLGGFLSSPLAVPLLTAACAAIPGAQVLVPFLPVIAPIAGMALSGVGGMAGQVGQGQAPSFDPSALLSPDMLAQVVPAITGMIGGAAGLPAGGLPLPIPAA